MPIHPPPSPDTFLRDYRDRKMSKFLDRYMDTPTPIPIRHYLPETRASITHKRTICKFEFYITVSFYEDAGHRCDPGEVFIVVSKNGSMMAGLLDGIAILISLSLQYGVPWHKTGSKFLHTRFGEADTQNSSILDGLVRGIDYIIAERASRIGEPCPSLPSAAESAGERSTLASTSAAPPAEEPAGKPSTTAS